MTDREIVKKFGFNPVSIGLRHRASFIVDKIEDDEELAGAKLGDLGVRARDGGSNPPDPAAFRKPNYRGTSTDGFDCTYRYYYFKPLQEKE